MKTDKNLKANLIFLHLSVRLAELSRFQWLECQSQIHDNIRYLAQEVNFSINRKSERFVSLYHTPPNLNYGPSLYARRALHAIHTHWMWIAKPLANYYSEDCWRTTAQFGNWKRAMQSGRMHPINTLATSHPYLTHRTKSDQWWPRLDAVAACCIPQRPSTHRIPSISCALCAKHGRRSYDFKTCWYNKIHRPSSL